MNRRNLIGKIGVALAATATAKASVSDGKSTKRAAPQRPTRVKITKIVNREVLGRIELEIQYEVTQPSGRVVRRKEHYRGNRAVELDLS